jgi:hypothetical protein
MAKYYLFGIVFGVAASGWLVYCFAVGTVNVNLSGMRNDYTLVTRAERPGTYWTAMTAGTVAMVLYWLAFFWFMPRLGKILAERAESARRG